MMSFADDSTFFPTQIQMFQFVDKYSRFNYELGRRETWSEAVQRSVDFLRELSHNMLNEADYDDIRQAMLEMRAFPSMRLFATAGEAARRDNALIYNCSYIPMDSIESLVEVLALGMSGSGVGFSVEHQFVDKLPTVLKQKIEPETPTFVIPDTTEGWLEAFRLGLVNWFSGFNLHFDYSQIRPAGSILYIKGGRASGPEPLQELLDFAKQKILNAQGRKLTPLEVHDIVCKVGDVSVSGAIRRAALISLFDFNDEEMLHSKDGRFWEFAPWRANANNSAVWPDEHLSHNDIKQAMTPLFEGFSGEPGIFRRSNIVKTASPHRKTKGYENTYGLNPCLTGDTLVYVADGRGHVPIAQLAEEGKDVPVFCYDDKKNITVRTMRNPRLTGTNEAVYKITLDSGKTIRATKNHQFLTKDGNWMAVKDLKPGQSLEVATRISKGIVDKNRSDYYFINNVAEHRLIAAFHYNMPVFTPGVHVHHKDFNSKNNSPNNLEYINSGDHHRLHTERMRGANNPMVRAQTEWSETKWQEYHDNMSASVGGALNGRYSGYTHEDLQQHALTLTRTIGQRFSINDWVAYARTHNLPLTFSGWRKNHLGGIVQLAKWAAIKLGLEYVDADPRVVKRYQAFLDQGYDVEVIENQVIFNKYCEVCDQPFKTKRPESGVCSNSCNNKRSWAKNNQKRVAAIRATLLARKATVREAQLQAYTDLQFELQRTPQKHEWVQVCKAKGVSPEIARESSPFRYWADLQVAAQDYNHKVVSVEYVGKENVYNGTVDDYHNFLIGDVAKANSDKNQYLVTKNCGEIALRPMEVCNLSSAIARATDTLTDLKEKVRIATIIGTIQSMATHFPNLRPIWAQNCIEERLLGVDINGMVDAAHLMTPKNLEILREYAVEINKEYAQKLGINQSASVTCVKPSGNSSVLFDTSSGIHARWSQYYIRRAQLNAESPVKRVLDACNVPLGKLGNKYVVAFPVKSPDGVVTNGERGAIEQLDFWKMVKIYWTTHNPSCTITYRPDEVEAVINWVYENQDIIGGISFLPYDDHVYEMAPYEKIDAETYAQLKAMEVEIDWDLLTQFENEDHTESAQLLACMSGVCEI